MNRTGLGLAVGAGYLLGRTKKLKMAMAVGGLVAGKKLNLSPRMIADLVQQQLKNNPQFKEIGDQLRGELQGVGKAASGALVERQLDALADRLHGRTAQMREQLTGGGRRDEDEDADDAYDDEEHEGEEPEDSDGEEDEEPKAKKAPAKKAPAKKAPAKKAARKAPAKKAPAKKTAAARKTASKKTSSARKTATGAGGSRSRQPKGGGEE